MIEAYRSGVLDLDVCIFALSEYSVHCRRLFVYQNQYLLNLDCTSPFSAHTQARAAAISAMDHSTEDEQPVETIKGKTNKKSKAVIKYSVLSRAATSVML